LYENNHLVPHTFYLLSATFLGTGSFKAHSNSIAANSETKTFNAFANFIFTFLIKKLIASLPVFTLLHQELISETRAKVLFGSEKLLSVCFMSSYALWVS